MMSAKVKVNIFKPQKSKQCLFLGFFLQELNKRESMMAEFSLLKKKQTKQTEQDRSGVYFNDKMTW